MEERRAGDDGRIRLAAAPGPSLSPGIHELDAGSARPTLISVPEPDGPAPVLVFFHGAGGDARQSLDLVGTVASRHEAYVVAPSSTGATWDLLNGNLGPDLATLQNAMSQLLSAADIDRSRVGIGGFSDGASYALSVGLANGDIFTEIVAFSPGFAAPPSQVGRPSIFISHGTSDRVLPIDRTSRRLVPVLRDAGYDVDHVEFDGGHGVPPAVAAEGLAWLGG